MTGRVYFIRDVDMRGPIKIGFSAIPEQRLRVLMQWSPVPLELVAEVPGTRALESNLHDVFADAHLHHEWFHPVRSLVEGIDRLRSGYPVEEAFDLNAISGRVRPSSHPWTAEQSLRNEIFHGLRRAARAFHAAGVSAPDDIKVAIAFVDAWRPGHSTPPDEHDIRELRRWTRARPAA